ncbi:MAG: hypothetical protein QNK04_20355 [Myxococcota bacterium]|nr:hypothetical protein [Myxococcota bacterium]
MEKYGSAGVACSPDYFDENLLRDLFQPSDEKGLRTAEAPPARFFELSNEEVLQAVEKSPWHHGPLPTRDARKACSDAWSTMLEDPEFAADVERQPLGAGQP